MVLASFSEGIRRAKKRPKLALSVWLVNLATGAAIMMPVYGALYAVVSTSGYSTDLAAYLNPVIWADIWPKIKGEVGQSFLLFLLVLPFYGLAKSLLQTGLTHALQGDAEASWWQGVRRFGGRGLLLSVLYGATSGLANVILLVLGGLITWANPTEVMIFWTWAVGIPVLVILVTGWLALQHDYARTALVLDHQTVGNSFRYGWKYPFQFFGAVLVFVLWMLVVGLLGILPSLFDLLMGTPTRPDSWIWFGLSQAVLFARAFGMVAWAGSTVTFYEAMDYYRPVRPPEAALEMPESAEMPPQVPVHSSATDLNAP